MGKGIRESYQAWQIRWHHEPRRETYYFSQVIKVDSWEQEVRWELVGREAPATRANRASRESTVKEMGKIEWQLQGQQDQSRFSEVWTLESFCRLKKQNEESTSRFQRRRENKGSSTRGEGLTLENGVDPSLVRWTRGGNREAVGQNWGGAEEHRDHSSCRKAGGNSTLMFESMMNPRVGEMRRDRENQEECVSDGCRSRRRKWDLSEHTTHPLQDPSRQVRKFLFRAT